jgi:hypothetical protein
MSDPADFEFIDPALNSAGAGTGSGADSIPEPIESIELPPPEDPIKEGQWLQETLHQWLNEEFLPEIINEHIAARASQVFVRQRMEGENNLNALVLAILTEMQGYDFSKSFYSEFAVANAVGDLLLESLGIERCCGNSSE